MTCTLPWIILFAPLVSAAIILILTGRLGKISSFISVGAVGVSFVCSILLFGTPDGSWDVPWITIDKFTLNIGVLVDPLAKMMTFIVTFIGLLVHVYSLGYMEKDSGKARYFAGLSLFMFSMLGIVLSNNFIMMFIFWELVGVSSYVLIGHWFTKNEPPEAAKKAFLMNKIGDFGFMLGILMLWNTFGTVAFGELEATIPNIAVNPVFMTVSVLLIFCGAVGKSAQMPLHTWLPDAMEGPTPVSALIHAATMVAAGVYMLARVAFVLHTSDVAMHVIAWIGCITLLFAGLVATQQNDIKRVLAYSTLSQLGYMFMALGLGAFDAGLYHLYTHAFFKALLFLAAGSVIVGMHHEQDLWKMGGLKNKMPKTFLTLGVGALALAGCPFLSGSMSKDTILAAAYEHDKIMFGIAMFTAFLTAFYVGRLFILAFLGGPRSEAARHGSESPWVMTVPLFILSFMAAFSAWPILARSLQVPIPEEHHGEGAMVVTVLAIVAFVSGLGLAWVLYRKATKDPLHIPLFANKFYFDEFYSGLVRNGQDLLASICSAFDRWVLDGLVVRGIAAIAWCSGYILRCVQIGNLQAYSFFFGAGALLVIYFTLFK